MSELQELYESIREGKKEQWKTLVIEIDFMPPNDEAEKIFIDHALKEMKPGQIADFRHKVVKKKG